MIMMMWFQTDKLQRCPSDVPQTRAKTTEFWNQICCSCWKFLINTFVSSLKSKRCFFHNPVNCWDTVTGLNKPPNKLKKIPAESLCATCRCSVWWCFVEPRFRADVCKIGPGTWWRKRNRKDVFYVHSRKFLYPHLKEINTFLPQNHLVIFFLVINLVDIYDASCVWCPFVICSGMLMCVAFKNGCCVFLFK